VLLGSLQQGASCVYFRVSQGAWLIARTYTGFRHLPPHDAQLSQYLFSTLFVQINVHAA